MTATIDQEVRDELRASVRRWVEREVLPVASDFEHADEYPAEIVEQMKAMGLFGITIPEEHGGLGTGTLMLQFAGDGTIAVEAECISVDLRDVARPHRAIAGEMPRHD